MSMGNDRAGKASPGPAGSPVFATTHWSVVLNAANADSPHALAALETLGREYWYPLYAFVRRRGYSPEDAQDLTQAYFERLLERNIIRQADRERGRFRTFLLVTLNRFLADEWNRAHRIKRGGSQTILSFDATTAEERYCLEPVEPADAAKLYERRWAATLVDRAIHRLEQHYLGRDQGRLFNGLRDFLLGEREEATYAEAAADLGLTTVAMKMAVSRMRARCRELLREEIARTVERPEEVEDEYRALLAALQ